MKSNLRIALLLLSVCVLLCQAQQTAPVLRLTPAETETVTRAAEALREADNRLQKAREASINLLARYNARHPELKGVVISDSGDLLISRSRSSKQNVSVRGVVPLSADEAKEARETLAEEKNAVSAAQQAAQDWRALHFEIIAAHITQATSGASHTLRDGRTVVVPYPWTDGLTFSEDFRLAFPYQIP